MFEIRLQANLKLPFNFELESDSQVQLPGSGASRSSKETEGRCSDVGLDCRKVGVVESIEHVGTQLHAQPFGDREGLSEAEIDFEKPGSRSALRPSVPGRTGALLTALTGTLANAAGFKYCNGFSDEFRYACPPR